MKQIPFQWREGIDLEEGERVVLETDAIEKAIELMAKALIIVVRGERQREEAANER